MKRILAAIVLGLAWWSAPALGQGCGPSNPNCIVPTAPIGTNNNQAASTAFVVNALAGSMPLTSGHVYVGNGSNIAVDTAPGFGFTSSAGAIAVNQGMVPTWTGVHTWGVNTDAIILTGTNNGTLGGTITNLSSGTAALARIAAINNGGGSRYGLFGIAGTGYTGITLLQNRAFIDAGSNSGGIVLNNEGANPTIFGTSNVEAARVLLGLMVGTTTDPGAGVANVLTGYRIGNAATSGNVLRGNGTNFISGTLAAADLSNGVTGSGAVVLATTPTIAGMTLSGAVSGGGNQLNNVIVGASTPLAGTFTTMTATNTIASTGSLVGALTTSITGAGIIWVGHAGTNQNLFVATPTVLTTGVRFGAVNDANTLFTPIQLQGLFTEIGATNSTAHLATRGNIPVLSSCGTNPAITAGSTDLAGEVTMGTGAPTGCVITFGDAYTSRPANCWVNWQATPLASQSWSWTNTAITTVQTGTSSNKINYGCIAQAGG